PDTLIRRQRAEAVIVSTPRVLGVDEFALRKGCTSGTLLVDLERRRPVAVLEGRTADPLVKWLQAHPDVAMLARDCAEAYAAAGRLALPAAQQVADRFHLLRNVGAALRTVLRSRRWHQPVPPAREEHMPQELRAVLPTTPSPQPRCSQPTAQKRLAWEAVQQHKATGQSLAH